MRGDEPVWEQARDASVFEFPACAGMNLLVKAVKPDPPGEFPACAGMNRWISSRRTTWPRVPRMRGDEPSS